MKDPEDTRHAVGLVGVEDAHLAVRQPKRTEKSAIVPAQGAFVNDVQGSAIAACQLDDVGSTVREMVVIIDARTPPGVVHESRLLEWGAELVGRDGEGEDNGCRRYGQFVCWAEPDVPFSGIPPSRDLTVLSVAGGRGFSARIAR